MIVCGCVMAALIVVFLVTMIGLIIGYCASLPLIGMQLGGDTIDKQIGINLEPQGWLRLSNATLGDSTDLPRRDKAIDSIPAVGPNGEIYAVWEDYGVTDPHYPVIVAGRAKKAEHARRSS